MYWMKQSKQENLIYLAAWGLLFASPLLSIYVRTVGDTGTTFDWSEVFVVWRLFAVYLILFLIHNFLLAPLFLGKPNSHQNKRVMYFSIVVMILAAFTVYQCNKRPEMRGPMPPMERADHHQPPHFGNPPKAAILRKISVTDMPHVFIGLKMPLLPSWGNRISWLSSCLR